MLQASFFSFQPIYTLHKRRHEEKNRIYSISKYLNRNPYAPGEYLDQSHVMISKNIVVDLI